MINLLLGPPGGGKSYEATVYHIIPALTAGRLVITNLPLDLERLAQIDQNFPELVKKIDNRTGTIKHPATRFAPSREEEGIIRAFATMEDYADPWRHPDTGAGPLYVIDECHLAMPRGSTSIEVEEWYSLHRHESADVLLITQSYGKVSKSIIDLVQVCYRVKKATAFGSAQKYIRKVQDGVRGEVVNTSIREYQKRYFGLYKSHTRGGGSELGAVDITPIWKRWPFIGAAACLVIVIGLLTFSPAKINPAKNGVKTASQQVKPVTVTEEIIKDGKIVSRVTTGQSEPDKKKDAEPAGDSGLPYEGRSLHVIGSIIRDGIARYLFAVSQNGQKVSEVDSRDLIKLGYKIEMPTPCAVKVTHGNWSKWVICDAPQIAVTPTGADTGERHDARPESRQGGGRATGAGGSLGGDSVVALPDGPNDQPRAPAAI